MPRLTAVISPDGLIGRIVDVRLGASIVQVLTDPASTVSAHLVRTRTPGIVEGDARGTLRFKYMARDAADTRAEFINRAFRDYFALPDEKADSKPPFIALMYHGRDTGAWQLPEDELSTFIAKRTEMIRVGDSTPININLADGQVLRFICTALPDGGRMLSYTPVTDLVRHTDDPDSGDYYRALRGSYRSLAHQLGAAE